MDDAPDDAEPALSMVGTTARVLSGVATTSALVVADAASSDTTPTASGYGDDDGASPSDTTVAVVQRLAERQKELDAVSAAAQRKAGQIDREYRTARTQLGYSALTVRVR